jgi:murein DD-endopeptidase MepM/ murein hydrolase activator NlpD
MIEAPSEGRAGGAGSDVAPGMPARGARWTTALAVVLGAMAGAALGLEPSLPLPGADAGRGEAGAASSLPAGSIASATLGSTAPVGPYHPVIGRVDYAEEAARFGGGRGHEGQDVFARRGTPLVAARTAVVIEKGSDAGRGNYVAIYAEGQDETYVYLHMLHPTSLRRGDRVSAGARVGEMGCTGSCDGTHLHFEIRRGRGTEARPIDPLPQLKSWPQAPTDGD